MDAVLRLLHTQQTSDGVICTHNAQCQETQGAVRQGTGGQQWAGSDPGEQCEAVAALIVIHDELSDIDQG